MLTNPVIEEQEEAQKERREKEAFRHPFVVTCVVPYIEDTKIHVSFRLIKRFCEDNQVPFSAREYDWRRYSEDRDEIAEMPAFHLYSQFGKHYWNTFFPSENPIQKIQDEILHWKQEEERKKEKKERWEKKVAGFIAFFEGLSLKKKPKIVEPERPKSLPAKVSLQLPDSMPKNRKGSV
jgi:hypothetical protein